MAHILANPGNLLAQPLATERSVGRRAGIADSRSFRRGALGLVVAHSEHSEKTGEMAIHRAARRACHANRHNRAAAFQSTSA
jgi:hypothetical protein